MVPTESGGWHFYDSGWCIAFPANFNFNDTPDSVMAESIYYRFTFLVGLDLLCIIFVWYLAIQLVTANILLYYLIIFFCYQSYFQYVFY